MTQKTKSKPPAKKEENESLYYVEIPADVRDSFVKLGKRKLSIVAFGIKRASQFQHHPNNPKNHPEFQQRVVEGSLNSLGWIDTPIENRTTGNLVDGHERVWNALKHDDSPVPYFQVDLTKDEEAQALLSIDPIAAMAETDQEQVDTLLKQVAVDDPDLMIFMESLGTGNGGGDMARGFEQKEELKPFKMVRVLISFPIDSAVFASELIDQLQEVEGIEIDYGAN